jgi:hypothetical protein
MTIRLVKRKQPLAGMKSGLRRPLDSANFDYSGLDSGIQGEESKRSTNSHWVVETWLIEGVIQ